MAVYHVVHVGNKVQHVHDDWRNGNHTLVDTACEPRRPSVGGVHHQPWCQVYLYASAIMSLTYPRLEAPTM